MTFLLACDNRRAIIVLSGLMCYLKQEVA